MKQILKILAGILILLVPTITEAHAFGLQFTLPLPFHIYAIGAGAALVASFAILGLFSTPALSGTSRYISKTFSIPSLRFVAAFLKALGIILLTLTLALAFLGSGNAFLNPAPILFWIIFLLGFTYLSALFGNLWEYMNPFKTIASWILPKNHVPRYTYPGRLGYIPALFFFFSLIWLELLSGGAGANPYVLGGVLVIYTLISIYGSALFGIRDWFHYSDFFSVFFRLVGKFAPLHITPQKIEFTPPGEHLLKSRTAHISILFFVLFMLSSTVFDGSKETEPWVNFIRSSDLFLNNYSLVSHVTLLFSPLVFFAFYAFAIFLMKLVTKTATSFSSLLLTFTYSLIPIAIVYHFAHYFGLLIFEGQRLIPMLSDPLFRDWDLFGTQSYQVNIGIIGADTVWYIMVGAILLGHILATYIAHRIALVEFESRLQIILGQLPMLFLMVSYTVFGLYVLSLPFGTGV
ncbi:MAG: hypothetical protein HYT93_04075 [Parcubacteria group bacterium]|nr:hypothetical protein [Parcubacteria group bacterium]